MHPLIQLKRVTPIFLIALACIIGLAPKTHAVSPPPDGGYPGGNTAEGQHALLSLTTGGFNTAIGFFSLNANTTGSFNTGVGAGALDLNDGNENTATGTGALLLNTTGANNTASGAFTLIFNSTGNDNTAVGDRALENNTTSGNTALGSSALTANTTGGLNTAVGAATLVSNITGNDNTGIGLNALFSNTDGSFNTAVGRAAMGGNTDGSNNTAVGWFALASNTTAGNNTAVGFNALTSNSGGTDNTAIGTGALQSSTGSFNTAVGFQALFSNTTGGSTAIGFQALKNLTNGIDNVALGDNAGLNQTTGTGNVYIGSGVAGVAAENNACYIRSIFGQTSATGIPVLVNAFDKLGTTTSSKRFKENIKPMDNSSEALFTLKPVTFRYKKEIDPAGTSQLGLVAEDVEKVNPDLIVRDKEGKPYSVRYDQVNAMLLNEFLKEHKTVQKQGEIIARQQKQIETLTAGLQKVSAQLATASPSDGGLEVSKFATGRIRSGGPAPQTVVKNQ